MVVLVLLLIEHHVEAVLLTAELLDEVFLLLVPPELVLHFPDFALEVFVFDVHDAHLALQVVVVLV